MTRTRTRTRIVQVSLLVLIVFIGTSFGSDVTSKPSPPKHLNRLGTLSGSAGEFAKFSPNGKYLLTTYFADARLWDIRTMKPLWPVIHLRAQIEAVQFIDDGKQLLIAADDGVAVYDARTGKLSKTVFAFKQPLSLAALSADGEVFAGMLPAARPSLRGRIIVGSISQGKILQEIPAIDVSLLRINANHQIMFVLLGDGQYSRDYQLWDLRSGHQIESDFVTRYQQRIARDSTDTPAAFSADGRRVVVANENSFHVIDAYTGAFIASPEQDAGFGHVRAVAFVDQDRSIAVRSDALRLADARTGQWLFPRRRPGATADHPYMPWFVDNHAISSDGKYAACSWTATDTKGAVRGGKLATYRLADGAVLGTAALDAPADAIAISADNRVIATSDGESNDTLLWKLASE